MESREASLRVRNILESAFKSIENEGIKIIDIHPYLCDITGGPTDAEFTVLYDGAKFVVSARISKGPG